MPYVFCELNTEFYIILCETHVSVCQIHYMKEVNDVPLFKVAMNTFVWNGKQKEGQRKTCSTIMCMITILFHYTAIRMQRVCYARGC